MSEPQIRDLEEKNDAAILGLCNFIAGVGKRLEHQRAALAEYVGDVPPEALNGERYAKYQALRSSIDYGEWHLQGLRDTLDELTAALDARARKNREEAERAGKE